MRYRIAAVAALATAALAGAGCNDSKFLTEVPYDFVGPANFYRNANDALAAVNGVYASFVATSGSQYYGGEFVMLAEYPTEMMTPYLSAGNERSQVDNYTFNPAHNYIYHTWQHAYSAINRANSVIDRVPAVEMDTTLRNRVVGEARFLRALHYFNLVRLFGGVPLYASETAGLDSLERPRSTAADAYALIIADLEQAAAVLPKGSTYGSTSLGRASRGAAKTLLAKALIQRAATGVGTTADYQAALGLLQDVEANEGYTLLANYADLFDMKHENNSEVIFDIQATRAPGLGERLSSQCAPRKSNYGSSQNGSFTAEQPFFDQYTTADKRRPTTWQLTFVDKSNTIVSWTTTATASGAYGADTPYMRKCLDSLSTGDDEQNFIILRYADNLLMKAEAINEISGPTAEAYAAVNAVRTRAGLPALVAGLAQPAFKDSLFAQRRLEMTFEGPNGFFDSQRHWAWASARIRSAMNLGLANRFRNSKYPKANPFCPAGATTCADVSPIPDKFKLFPIPQKAMDLNPLLRDQQNPGW
jgi:starch-binding outer membrane protein, SusD/RagB family